MRQKNPFKADLKIIKEKETNLKGLNICEYILWKIVRAPNTISLILIMYLVVVKLVPLVFVLNYPMNRNRDQNRNKKTQFYMYNNVKSNYNTTK